jgi:hypothetical protein
MMNKSTKQTVVFLCRQAIIIIIPISSARDNEWVSHYTSLTTQADVRSVPLSPVSLMFLALNV